MPTQTHMQSADYLKTDIDALLPRALLFTQKAHSNRTESIPAYHILNCLFPAGLCIRAVHCLSFEDGSNADLIFLKRISLNLTLEWWVSLQNSGSSNGYNFMILFFPTCRGQKDNFLKNQLKN